MASLTVENYAKTIYQIVARAGRAAATGEIAASLAVSPGTVTSMLKTLGETGLAVYTPYEGATLTSAGRTLALRVLRRHRLIELFLVKTLHLDWDEVHAEAENMEHAVSDHLVDRIDEFLGYPEADPHGDPIPKADGTVAAAAGRSLVEWPVGAPFELVRVLDQSRDFLRFLSEQGLPLGVRGRVESFSDAAGVVTVSIDGRRTTLSRDAASRLRVSAPVEVA